ncbi:MAG: hydrogen peroxide-inducible genes activator [Alphaproteobacteria bacterium]|nr:hydrogen peroxide-inducible genes activator [Alphaproteobacteria bacterium]
MIRPTLRQINYLIALKDEKSFSRAAETCLVTQSTLSAGIRDLENIFGQTLVNRAGRNITLTPLGSEIALQGQKMLEEIDLLIARAHQTREPLSGPLRLGVIPTIAPYLLPKILPTLKEKFPALELQLHEDLSGRLVEQIHNGRLDGILMAFPYETGGLEHHIIFEEDFLLAAPKNKELPKSLTLEDLKPQELLLLEDGHCLRDHALAACGLQRPSARKTFSATSLATLIQMVAYGYGVTLLPEMALNPGIIPDNICLIPFKNPAPTRKIGLAWPKNSPQKKDLQHLFKAISSSINRKENV